MIDRANNLWFFFNPIHTIHLSYRFICDCAQAAVSNGNRYFGIQYYAECWSGTAGPENFTELDPSKSCVNSSFGICSADSEHCTGAQFTNLIYRVPDHLKLDTKKPIATTKEPPTTTKEPPTTTKEPPTTTKEPPTTTKEPPTTRKEPPTTTKRYITTKKTPTTRTTTKLFTTTTNSPTTTTKHPTTITKHPTTTTKPSITTKPVAVVTTEGKKKPGNNF